MKKNGSVFILVFEVIAIVSLHAVKMNQRPELPQGAKKPLKLNHQNAAFALPVNGNYPYTLVSIK
jgi:hypothetical protein